MKRFPLAYKAYLSVIIVIFVATQRLRTFCDFVPSTSLSNGNLNKGYWSRNRQLTANRIAFCSDMICSNTAFTPKLKVVRNKKIENFDH